MQRVGSRQKAVFATDRLVHRRASYFLTKQDSARKVLSQLHENWHRSRSYVVAEPHIASSIADSVFAV